MGKFATAKQLQITLGIPDEIQADGKVASKPSYLAGTTKFQDVSEFEKLIKAKDEL